VATKRVCRGAGSPGGRARADEEGGDVRAGSEEVSEARTADGRGGFAGTDEFSADPASTDPVAAAGSASSVSPEDIGAAAGKTSAPEGAAAAEDTVLRADRARRGRAARGPASPDASADSEPGTGASPAPAGTVSSGPVAAGVSWRSPANRLACEAIPSTDGFCPDALVS